MNQLIVRIRSTMDRLNQLWDEVHMEERARESRVEYAYLHFYTLLDEIVSFFKIQHITTIFIYNDV